jgi:hypothetical protein
MRNKTFYSVSTRKRIAIKSYITFSGVSFSKPCRVSVIITTKLLLQNKFNLMLLNFFRRVMEFEYVYPPYYQNYLLLTLTFICLFVLLTHIQGGGRVYCHRNNLDYNILTSNFRRTQYNLQENIEF